MIQIYHFFPSTCLSLLLNTWWKLVSSPSFHSAILLTSSIFPLLLPSYQTEPLRDTSSCGKKEPEKRVYNQIWIFYIVPLWGSCGHWCFHYLECIWWCLRQLGGFGCPLSNRIWSIVLVCLVWMIWRERERKQRSGA